MNDTLIVTVYVVLDDLLRAMGHRTESPRTHERQRGIDRGRDRRLPVPESPRARSMHPAPSATCRGRSPSRASTAASTPSPTG
jgi:hypothetical protein